MGKFRTSRRRTEYCNAAIGYTIPRRWWIFRWRTHHYANCERPFGHEWNLDPLAPAGCAASDHRARIPRELIDDPRTDPKPSPNLWWTYRTPVR